MAGTIMHRRITKVVAVLILMSAACIGLGACDHHPGATNGTMPSQQTGQGQTGQGQTGQGQTGQGQTGQGQEGQTGQGQTGQGQTGQGQTGQGQTGQGQIDAPAPEITPPDDGLQALQDQSGSDWNSGDPTQ